MTNERSRFDRPSILLSGYKIQWGHSTIRAEAFLRAPPHRDSGHLDSIHGRGPGRPIVFSWATDAPYPKCRLCLFDDRKCLLLDDGGHQEFLRNWRGSDWPSFAESAERS